MPGHPFHVRHQGSEHGYRLVNNVTEAGHQHRDIVPPCLHTETVRGRLSASLFASQTDAPFLTADAICSTIRDSERPAALEMGNCFLSRLRSSHQSEARQANQMWRGKGHDSALVHTGCVRHSASCAECHRDNARHRPLTCRAT